MYVASNDPVHTSDKLTRRSSQWQAAYDKLAEHVFANEPTTMTYYFGIPMDYADDISGTTSMFAFEVYGKREVSNEYPLYELVHE